MATLPSVALMFPLQTKHLGDQSLLVFLDKIAALLVPPHTLLRAIGLFLASRHLRQQKKHHRPWQLDPGYSGTVNQNAKAHQPGPDRIRTIWEARHFRHCSTPVILSVKIPRLARGTSVGKLIEIAISAIKCFSQDGQDSYSNPLSRMAFHIFLSIQWLFMAPVE